MYMDASEWDAALFFDAVPGAYGLYRAFADAVAARWPDATCRVQKTQITFTNPRVFACVSLLRAKRKAELPDPWITISLGLPCRLASLSRALDHPYRRRFPGGARRRAARLGGTGV